MREKLFTVEDHFQINGRGIVVTGQLEPDSPVFKVGSEVILVRPDGEEFVTEVIGIEHIKVINNQIFNRNRIGVLLKNINFKEDIPIGAEVFLDKS